MLTSLEGVAPFEIKEEVRPYVAKFFETMGWLLDKHNYSWMVFPIKTSTKSHA